MNGASPWEPVAAASAAPGDIGRSAPRPSGDGPSAPPDPGDGRPDQLGDSGIVAGISAAVHKPFVDAWGRYDADVWQSIRRTLEDAAAAHERALDSVAIAGTEDASARDGEREELAGKGNRDASAGGAERNVPGVSGVLARYRNVVSRDVIEPVRVVLAGSNAATMLEESLTAAARRARASLAELPAIVQAPASRLPDGRPSGVGPIRAIKRAAARLIGPVVWRGRLRRVPVARLARQHLDQVVLRAQADAFRRSRRDRTEWLGRLERAWAEWAAVVLPPLPAAGERRPPGDPASEMDPQDEIVGIHRAAGAALQAELRALIDEGEPASGGAGSADFPHLEELLAASVAVAGTFAADPPSSRPGPGRQRELAVQWDARAEGAAARLELYQSLVAIRWSADGLLTALRKDWSRAVRRVDDVLAEIAAELERGGERARRLSADEEVPTPMIEAERKRTDVALARIQGALPTAEALFDALTAAVEESIHGLDAVREQVPATLALHDIPPPGHPPRQPASDPRSVRLREAFLQAFDTLRRERMRAAPSAIRETMHRIRSEVADLREVSEYGYEAAVAEARDGRDPDTPHPTVLVVNGLTRAGAKAAAARELLREALVAAERGVAIEIATGSRRMIEQVTADRVTAGYLEARTYLAAAFVRLWRRARRLSSRAGGRAAAVVSWALGLLRPLSASMGLGPPLQTVVGRREHSLAHADEYPPALPVVYRRLFSLEPLADARLLTGREDALAAVATAWTRRATGEARSLVVIAAPGVGMTSFLNVVTGRLSAEAPGGIRRRFTTRVRAEAHLAKSLARWLGLGETDDLDLLAHRVLEAPTESVPAFAVLEATEHLHMRAPAGSRLFERLLTFMSRTESRVFWIAAMTSTAWQLAEKRAPAFVHDIERITLGELSPEALRQAVLARHRLSGLPLRFAEPRDGRAALRRRARQLRGPDKQEQLIETDYFQRLHRAAQGSPRLALFHWLRSADFTSTAGSLVVQPPSMLDSGTGNLDRTQSFALKAILDHGTLTSDEYCEIARTSGPESLHILRSLEECRVIERVPATAGEKPVAQKVAGNSSAQPRYRIRPLMIGAVGAHLRSRNILH